MDNLSNFVVDAIQNDEVASKFVVLYAGRFQPFHPGHYESYRQAVSKFGRDNVYISTSDKTDPIRSPLSFKEKKTIITQLFDVPKNRIVKVKNPYIPIEFTSKLDPNTAIIYVVGKKDVGRFTKSKYFHKFKNTDVLAPFSKASYVWSPQESSITGTEVRKRLRGSIDINQELLKIYKSRKPKAFDILIDKFAGEVSVNEIERFIETGRFTDVLNELSSTTSSGGYFMVDDGPAAGFAKHNIYKTVSKERATKIGYQVIDYILGNSIDDSDNYPTYPNGPVDSVSFFPAGVAGKTSSTNQHDIVGATAWNKWFKHATRVSTIVGYELVRTQKEREELAKEKKQSVADSRKNQTMNESVMYETNTSVIDDCISFTLKELGIDKRPPISFTDQREDIETTAYYNPNTHDIKVYTHKRALADVLRSVVHELVHHKQNLENRLNDENSPWAINDTDPLETEAHALAGDIITKFKKIAPTNIYINEASGPFKYACCMLETKIGSWNDILSMIDESDIVELEEDPHITLLYGIHSDVSHSKVAEIVSKHTNGPVQFEITGISLFENSEYDVLKFDVNGDQLYQINDSLTNLPHTSNFPDYHPHITIAYLKSGTGQKYVKQFDTPITLESSTFLFSHPTNDKISWSVLNETPDMIDGIDGVQTHYQKKQKHVPGGVGSKRTSYRSAAHKKGFYVNEMSKYELDKVEQFADIKLSPVDVKFTRHFFERLNDPRNGEPIDFKEMVSFFQRLAANKKRLKEFLTKYQEIVVTDDKSSINIPFVKRVNSIIAKTIMRKRSFSTPDPKLRLNEASFVDEENGLVMCAECGKWMKQIQYRHLKYSHDMTISEYRIKYPGIPLLAESAKNKGELNPMKNPDVKKRHLDIVTSESYRKNMKKATKGKNKGNLRPDLAERNKDIEYRKLISAGVKKSYENSELRKIRSKNFSKYRNSEAYRRNMYSIGVWTRPENKKEFQLYQENVRLLTNENFRIHFHEIPNSKKRNKEWHLDHKYSIYNGFKNGIPVEVISHYKNLEIVHRSINESKSINNSIHLSELLHHIKYSSQPLNKKILLLCGGGYGHLNHIFEDMDLTFGDMKEIIRNTLLGELKLAVEKTDGQNMLVSYRNDTGVIFARNKGHLKNFGENAMDVNGVAQMFSDRGDISDAFAFAANDMKAAITKLSAKDRNSIFSQGSKWMSFEVIYPATQNVIPYNHNLLVFHGSMEYDKTGNPIGEDRTSGKKLVQMIEKVNANVQTTFEIKGPPSVKLPKVVNFASSQSKYLSKLNKLQSKYKLKDSDKIALYHQKYWENFIDSKHTLSEKERMGLVKRWAFDDRSFRIRQIVDASVRKWADSVDKKDRKRIASDNMKPFEILFMELGTEVLQNLNQLLAANPSEAADQMKRDTEAAIQKMSNSTDPKDIEFLNKHLEKIQAAGGIEKIVPTEGIVFSHSNGKTYKITGIFAGINQLLGYYKFKR